MLTFAISTFFILALFGAGTVIGMMFFPYRGMIVGVIQNELRAGSSETTTQTAAYRHRMAKAPQLMSLHRSSQPAPLRAAA